MILTILLLARLVSWFFPAALPIAFHGILGIVLASTLVIIPHVQQTGRGPVVRRLCCLGGFAWPFYGPSGSKIQKDAG